MNTRRLAAVAVVAALTVLGGWLLLNFAGPAPEGAARRSALRAFAPGADGVLSESVVVSEPAVPVVVNLSDIPAGVYDPDNQLDRYLRGEIDLSAIESIVSPAEQKAMQEDALRLPESSAVQNAAAQAPQARNLNSGTAFDSMDYTECCGGGGNVPPDPEIAAGPNHVIAVVNVALEVYDTSGTSLVGPTTFTSFMAADPNCRGVFDPNAIYDEEADRFILGIDADGDYYCVAVSQTGDPTGDWNLYSFFAGNQFFDYPHAGVGRDAIYMGGNMFGTFAFDEARVWAFDKWAMYDGQAAQSVMRSLPTSEDTPQPLHLHGWNQGTWPTSGPHYFFTNRNFNGETYTVWSWDDPFGANSLSQVGVVNLENATGVQAGIPLDVPQQGGANLQANDFRPQDFEYRDGFGWSIQTISCNPGGGTVNCVRWAKINLANATVADAGVYASPGEYRFFGDLAVNACGDMALGYTKSSPSMFPGVWTAGRESADAPGTLQAESQLKAGEVTYIAFDSTPRRWGDYTEMTIAPDGQTFWYLGEYSKNTGTNSGRWGTYIGSFTFPDCDPGGGVTPTPTSTPEATATPTSTPEPGDNSVHIGDLDALTRARGSSRWSARVIVTVHDQNDAPLGNATVSGSWSTGGSGSCTTDSSGNCSIDNRSLTGDNTTFSVTNVSRTGYTYNPSANHDPDGDSDGTSIFISIVDGTPTPTATPTATPSPTATPTATSTPEPSDDTLHVGDLDGLTRRRSGTRWAARVIVLVHDQNDAPLGNATVSGTWSTGGSGSCTTGSSGQCAIDNRDLSSASTTFTVTDVSRSGYTYDATANHDPDGDSNGTSISLTRP